MIIIYLIACISTMAYSSEIENIVISLPIIETIQDVPDLYLKILETLNKYQPRPVLLPSHLITLCSIINTRLIDLHTLDIELKKMGLLPHNTYIPEAIQKICGTGKNYISLDRPAYSSSDTDYTTMKTEISNLLSNSFYGRWYKSILLDYPGVVLYKKNGAYPDESLLLNAIMIECKSPIKKAISEEIECNKRILLAFIPEEYEKNFRDIFLITAPDKKGEKTIEII